MSAPKLEEVQRVSGILLKQLLEELGTQNAARGAVILIHTLGRLCGIAGIPDRDGAEYWSVVVNTEDMRVLFRLAFDDERLRLKAQEQIELVTSLTPPRKPSDPNAN